MTREKAKKFSFSIWLRATFLGWVIGFFLVIGLVLIWDAIGVGSSQFMIGVGMGAGVGFMQGRAAKGWLDSPKQWLTMSAIGMGAPFVVFDIFKVLNYKLPYSLPISIAAGGLLTGLLQMRLLPRRSAKMNLWPVAGFAGWALAGGASSLADSLRFVSNVTGVLGALLYILIVLAGGVILGTVTGGVLMKMFSRN